MIYRWRDPWGKECTIAAPFLRHPFKFLRLVRAARAFSLLHEIDRINDLEEYKEHVKAIRGRGGGVELRVIETKDWTQLT